MTIETIIIGALSIIATACALGVVWHRKAIYSAVLLIAVQCCIAACFFLLGSTVLAVLQLIVYAGAIMVLFLFIIMVIGQGPESRGDSRLYGQGLVGLLAAVALIYGGTGLVAKLSPLGRVEGGASVPEIKVLGRIILVDYVYLFEVVSLLLLAAMVAAIMLAKGRKGEDR